MVKKQFIDKKFAKKFKLLPSSTVANETPTEEYKPSKAHIEEQRQFGVFYDDNYDYLQHMRARDEGSTLMLEDEVRTIVRAPAFPAPFGAPEKKVVFEADIESALDGNVEGDGDLEDDFITMAGGVVEDKMMLPRLQRPLMDDDSDFEDEDEDDMDFNRGYNEYDMEDEDEEEDDETGHDANRDVDAAFEAMLEADYNDDQVGELEGDACDLTGAIEPNDARLRSLVGEKRGMPEYDEEYAKQYVRDRIKFLAKHGEEETEEVELEVSASKRMKWDCESFATQYSNCYNHPSLIKEAGISRRGLKKMERKAAAEAASLAEEEEEDEEMEEDDDQSVCTTATTIRRRGETTEERKERKSVVKEQRRQRRVEKKENQMAFKEERKKATASRFGQIRARPVV